MTSGPGEWSLRQVQVVLGLAALAAIALVVGLVLLIGHGPTGAPQVADAEATTPASGDSPDQADQIAAATLPSVAPELARPGELTTSAVGSVVIPPAQELGPAQVPTGFPQTVAGAVAQLAAIDVAALGSGSIPRAQQVIGSWAVPGGPDPETWSGVRATAAFLSAAGLAADGSAELGLEVKPAMVLIKGQLHGPLGDAQSAGPLDVPRQPDDHDSDSVSFVVPCLQLVLTARMGSTTRRTAVADCQRMVWTGDRWMVGPGAEPAPAPSVWPGSPTSYELGFRWLEVAP